MNGFCRFNLIDGMIGKLRRTSISNFIVFYTYHAHKKDLNKENRHAQGYAQDNVASSCWIYDENITDDFQFEEEVDELEGEPRWNEATPLLDHSVDDGQAEENLEDARRDVDGAQNAVRWALVIIRQSVALKNDNIQGNQDADGCDSNGIRFQHLDHDDSSLDQLANFVASSTWKRTSQ